MKRLERSDVTRRDALTSALAGAVTMTVAGRAAAQQPVSTLRNSPAEQLRDAPDLITAFTEHDRINLTRQDDTWSGGGITVRLHRNATRQGPEIAILVRAPSVPLMRIHLRWRMIPKPGLHYLGDHWERSYGDLAWRELDPDRPMPWYFLASAGERTFAAGVKTNPGAFCFWQVDGEGVNLWLDVRNGGSGVELGDRELTAASLVAEDYDGVSAYAAAHYFCVRMCDGPRLPKQPVYGGNDWYYAYGHNTAEGILRDSNFIASAASDQHNRPWMVIDDGWSLNPTAGPWRAANTRFKDMSALATKMRAAGVRPGLWTRSLFTMENVSASWRLSSPAARKQSEKPGGGITLDPTVPEVSAMLAADVRRFQSWGYELIKHDYSTYDLLGRWGFTMGPQLTDDAWHFADRTKTTAEIMRGYYETMRAAAGDTMLLGCNTVGHLGAGLFELQRIGDDTSGRDWNRTRKMGVNTLAFRIAQHGTFFAVDADCVGLTRDVPWALNRQWLDLVARSSTPLFVSAAPDAVGPEQLAALKKAFAVAALEGAAGEPRDWMNTTQPERWLLRGEAERFQWAGDDGASPFVS